MFVNVAAFLVKQLLNFYNKLLLADLVDEIFFTNKDVLFLGLSMG